jgi:preprotein translocase subunit Sss1
MVTRLVSDRHEVVVLRPDEERAWELLLQHYREDVQAGMFRALFDDVRPAWEEYVATKEPAGEKVGVEYSDAPQFPGEFMLGMYRALFDDVRPAWEEYVATKQLADRR